ncbi:hypothetical protein GCM10009725_19310 [Aeromicrobium tamlense]
MRDAERLQVVVGDREADDHLVGGQLDVLDAEHSVQAGDVAHGPDSSQTDSHRVTEWRILGLDTGTP